jgi:hypothetical protein
LDLVGTGIASGTLFYDLGTGIKSEIWLGEIGIGIAS